MREKVAALQEMLQRCVEVWRAVVEASPSLRVPGQYCGSGLAYGFFLERPQQPHTQHFYLVYHDIPTYPLSYLSNILRHHERRSEPS